MSERHTAESWTKTGFTEEYNRLRFICRLDNDSGLRVGQRLASQRSTID